MHRIIAPKYICEGLLREMKKYSGVTFDSIVFLLFFFTVKWITNPTSGL